MSCLPTNPKLDVQQLLDEGLEIDIRQSHLLVHAVPYVTAKKEVAFGVLACPYSEDAGPADHALYFQGEAPHNALGQPLDIMADETVLTLFDKFVVHRRFSNKPTGVAGFPKDFYVKILHYVDLIQAQAKALDPDVDARTGRFILSRRDDSIFRYPDSWSARAGIMAISQKLGMVRIAIVGLGGTGGYILDQVAKTPVKEIHLFDAKGFKRHNAFRAPGAASSEALQENLTKVEYFAKTYDVFRKGIIAHPYHLDENNFGELAGFDFVFVSVDDGQSRRLLSQYLQGAGIPFIDVGMGIERTDGVDSLIGICRVTAGTPGHYDHLAQHLPIEDDRTEALYRSNIQVADMNAMNAMMAVIRWKQYCGFYADYDKSHNLTFSIAQQSLVREEPGQP